MVAVEWMCWRCCNVADLVLCGRTSTPANMGTWILATSPAFMTRTSYPTATGGTVRLGPDSFQEFAVTQHSANQRSEIVLHFY